MARARGDSARTARIRTLLKVAAAGGLALALAGACSAGTAVVGAHPNGSAVGLGSIAPKMTQTPAAQTCDPAAQSLAPAAQSANGADVRAIRNRGYLTVGVAADQYLTGYLAASGAEEGFDIDLAYAIAKSLFGAGYQNKVRFVALSTDKRIPDLQNHRVDLVIDTMTITCDRLAQVDFSAVYYEASQKLLVESGSHYSSLADLGGEKVCAQAGSTSIQLIQAAASKPIAYQVTDISDCLVLLQQNQVSAISTDDTILAGLAKQDPNLTVVGQPLEPEPYGVAMPHGESDMEQYVNQVLAQYEADGSWAASYKHWLAPSLGPADPPVARYSD
jgi:polar amino acid transport system substrate-binding protein